MKRMRIAISLIAALAALGGLARGGGEGAAVSDPRGPARAWLALNPPDGTNAPERRARMALIQAACDALSQSNYQAYAAAWQSRGDEADRLEAGFPALRYLREATLRTVADIRRTRVERGVAVWFVYNMGHVFKTPTACFGIDLCGRDVEQLAPDLDFLLVSHAHGDHNAAPLRAALLQRHKPVVTRGAPGTTVVTAATNLMFGDVSVKIDIGDHHRGQTNQLDNMLMFEVDGGPAANGVVIYHSGDGSNFEKMRPSKPVDVFIPHVSVGMSIPAAIAHLKPRMTLVSHVLELGHSPTPPQAWRWSYAYAFSVIRDLPEREATVLTWGERWLVPGTVLRAP